MEGWGERVGENSKVKRWQEGREGEVRETEWKENLFW